MNGYAFTSVFQSTDIVAFDKATEIVEWLPEHHDNTPLRCHEVARIVAGVLAADIGSAVVVDGWYLGPAQIRIEHSWVQLRHDVILDPYCPGRMPPVALVNAPYKSCNWTKYRASPEPRADIRADIVAIYVESWLDRLKRHRFKFLSLDGLHVSAGWSNKNRAFVKIHPPKPMAMIMEGLTMIPIMLGEIDISLTAPAMPTGRLRLADLEAGINHVGADRYREMYVFADELDVSDRSEANLCLDLQPPRGVVRVVRSSSIKMPMIHGTADALRVEMATLRAIELKRCPPGVALPTVAVLRGVAREHDGNVYASPRSGTNWNRIFVIEHQEGGWRSYGGPLLPFFKEALLPPAEDE